MSGRPSLSPRLVMIVSAALLAVALAYFGLKILQLNGRIGYDFRFLWLAGETWGRGENPYLPVYQQIGQTVFAQGNQPPLWVYPPTWMPIVLPFSWLDPAVSNVVWNLVTLVTVLLACALYTATAFRALGSRGAGILSGRAFGAAGILMFSGLVFALATLEATAIHLSTGQTAGFTLLGAALLCSGMVTGRVPVGALGLALVMLKPQIGLPFAVPLLFFGPFGRQSVAGAVLLSLLMCVPAMLIAPSAPLDFVRNLLGYDGFTDANLPQSMTGLRLMVFRGGGWDMGNPLALGVTLCAALVLLVGPSRIAAAPDSPVLAWQRCVVISAVVVGLAPLHIYDFVLVAPVLIAVAVAGPALALLGFAGFALMWRSENLAALTGWHGAGVAVFPGSFLATIGALVLLVAALAAVQRLNGRATTIRA